jgi:3-oxoacyl-[acyl-carrier-protein] synthase II
MTRRSFFRSQNSELITNYKLRITNSPNTYINGIGLISPQKTAGTNDFLSEITEHHSDFLKCIDPNYKEFIEPIQARRMSRLIKMGITAARLSLSDAGCGMPDAIITCTGLGSVEDTEKILGTIHLDQPFLNPTPFMQSTYNTISSQVAINLKCHGYNSTYVHRTLSFESGLIDAILQIEGHEASTVLTGGIDEMTMNHLNIVRRLGEWKREPFRNLDLFTHPTPGALAGEGAGFFLLSSEKTDKSYARIRSVKTLYKPGGKGEIISRIGQFLQESGLKPEDIGVFLAGFNGDPEQDRLYHEVAKEAFSNAILACYKHLCGEYHTSTAFALWAAANIIRRQEIPEILKYQSNIRSSPENILIYNHYRGMDHSLILVTN